MFETVMTLGPTRMQPGAGQLNLETLESTPVPDKVPEAVLLASESWNPPVRVPDPLGVNTMENVQVPPEEITKVLVQVFAVTPKSAPLVPFVEGMLESVIFPAEVLVAVTVCAVLPVPIAWLVNVSVFGENEMSVMARA
jgi:hypothetical protein